MCREDNGVAVRGGDILYLGSRSILPLDVSSFDSIETPKSIRGKKKKNYLLIFPDSGRDNINALKTIDGGVVQNF